MTTGVFLMAVYGMLTISGLFMLPAWLGCARTARKENDKDYALVANGLALQSAGTALVFGARLFYGFETGNWQAAGDGIGNFSILIGLALLEASKIVLMSVRRRHGKARLWWIYVAASLGWTAFAIYWTWVEVAL